MAAYAAKYIMGHNCMWIFPQEVADGVAMAYMALDDAMALWVVHISVCWFCGNPALCM